MPNSLASRPRLPNRLLFVASIPPLTPRKRASYICVVQKQIRPLEASDIPQLKQFADQAIGSGYYSIAELEDIFKKSQLNGKMCSLLLIGESSEIQGLRLTYPPGNWQKGKGRHLSPHLWKVPVESTAYFQSLFLASEVQGQGWGEKLSLASIEILKNLGAKAVVCHSWVESPGNSSSKYLLRLGFLPLIRYPNYWKEVDYVCTRCGKPCLCTAEEMILRF